jgi:hypothetical protein
MNPFIPEAVAIFRQFPNASDEEILRKLVVMGCERLTAARLVEFVPMAYCRLLLGDSGVTFSDRFQRKLAGGSISAERLLETEPLWAEAVSFAKAEKTAVTGKALLAVAAHSSEFDAANQLANQGSKLKDIILMPVVLQWSEEGPPV